MLYTQLIQQVLLGIHHIQHLGYREVQGIGLACLGVRRHGACGNDSGILGSTFILMCSVCGVTAKDSYKHVFPLTVIMPIFLTILCIIMTMAGII